MRLQSESGFSVLEMLIVAGLTGALCFGSYYAILLSVGFEKKTSAQALLDTEFSHGLHLANNASRLLPYVNAGALGACLYARKGMGCEVHGSWRDFPETVGPREPEFQAKFDLRGPCVDPASCLVSRRMRFRWVCGSTSCEALEIEVTAVGRQGGAMKDRSSRIRLDRSLFADRGRLEFHCDAGEKSLVGIDYDRLVDLCDTIAPATCVPPLDFFTEGGDASDCKPALSANCGSGFAGIGLDGPSGRCVSP